MARFSARSLLLIVLLALGQSRASAAELVMFEEPGCPWCQRWHTEVGSGYGKSSEGGRAPLRVVDLHSAWPRELLFIKSIRASPTFVLIDGGKEFGRITGYPGADFFWGLLGQMLERLPPDGRSATRCPSGRRDALSAGDFC